MKNVNQIGNILMPLTPPPVRRHSVSEPLFRLPHFSSSGEKDFHLPSWLAQADAVAALGVSLIVIRVSSHMARETIDALMDRAPETFVNQVHSCLENVKHLAEVHQNYPRPGSIAIHTEPPA